MSTPAITADRLGVRFQFDRQSRVVSPQLARLRRRGEESWGLRDVTVNSGVVIYDIRTGHRRYSVMQRLGTDRMFPALHISRGNEDRVRCTGVERSVDRAGNRATVSIPRRCLGSPGWVRVGAGVAKFDATETSFTYLLDDALRDAVVVDELALSPRVRRG